MNYSVYCIHMEERTDLIEILKPVTDFFGEKFHFFPGVKVTDDDFTRLILMNVVSPFYSGGRDNKTALKNEFGCALAHINVWKKIINEKINYALILEDGICFDTELYNNSYTSIENSMIQKKKDILFINSSFDFYIKDGRKLLNGYGLNGYFISLSGAKKLVDKSIPLMLPVDLVVRELCNTHFLNYSMIPNIVTRNVDITHCIDSEASPNHQDYSVNEKQNMNTLLFRIFNTSGNFIDLL